MGGTEGRGSSEGSRRRSVRLAGWIGATVLSALAGASAAEPFAGAGVSYPMSADGWATAPPVGWIGPTAGAAKFARYEGMPNGTMTLNEGVASANRLSFANGTIDFDMKPIGYDDAGIVFHTEGTREGEFVYLRANPDCPAADDCIQYAPVVRGTMGWNIYPNYQGPAPISSSGWNHVRVQVAGDKMAVFINHAVEPSLVVPVLRGLRRDGGIAFKGPGVFANLVIHPGEPSDLPEVTPEAVAPGTVTAWLAAPPSAYERARPVTAGDIPPAAAWAPIASEPNGLVNLGRAYGLARDPSLSAAWLKTVVEAKGPMRAALKLGFASQAWVFLNGRLVYSGQNTYFPPERRLTPDGRIEPDNAVIPLDLRAGGNEIVLAIGNDWRPFGPTPKPSHYGWAAEAHFDPADGLDVR